MTWGRASWWSWLVTVSAVVAGRLGWALGLPIAIGVTAVHALVLAFVPGRRFGMQVRAAYVWLLCLGIPTIHWMQAVGGTVLLLFDYCMLARLLVLMPWNRDRPLTGAFVRALFLSAPSKGSILARVDELSAKHASA